MSGPTVDVLEGPAALTALPGLAGLLDAAGAPITARAPWLTCWAQASSDLPLLVLVREGGEPRAAAPLAVRRRGPVSQLRAWGHQDSDQVCLPAHSPAAAELLADGLLGYLRRTRRPWTLRVEQVPLGDRVAAALAAALPRAELLAGDVSPRTRFGPDRTLAAHLSRNGRRSALQAGNRLAAAGLEPQIAYWRTPEDVQRLLPELAALRRRRDHALGRPSALDTPARSAFFRSVLLDAASSGEVELATLHVAGTLTAYDVCLRDRGWLRLWDGRIDPDYLHYGVGKLLDARVLERALADPDLTGVDWMRGDEPYKSRSANERVEHQHLQASSSPLAWAVSFGTTAARAATRARVSEHPAALARWRAAKTRVLTVLPRR